MPTLTRRRDPDASHETSLIFYGDVHVGTIAMGSAMLPAVTNGRGTAGSIRVAIPATLATASQPVSMMRAPRRRRRRCSGRCLTM